MESVRQLLRLLQSDERQSPNKETPELSGVANARAPNNDIGPMPTGNVSKAAVCMGLCVSSHQLS